MTTSEKIRKIKQDLIRKQLQQYESWLLSSLLARFPDKNLTEIIESGKVEVQKWPNETILLVEGEPFAIWYPPKFKTNGMEF